MNDFVMRPYRPADQRDVIHLWAECSLIVPYNNPALDIQRKLKVHPEWFLVGLVEGAVAATCMVGYDGHRGWVNYLAVSPRHRRRGLGALLMKEAERVLGAAGCPKINLQVRTSNRDVVAFYEQIGYTRDDVLSLGKRLVEDGPCDTGDLADE